MDRDDIFKLLLIILLLTNNSTGDCNTSCGNSLLGNINSIIIIMLLLNAGDFNTATDTNTATNFTDTNNPFSTTF